MENFAFYFLLTNFQSIVSMNLVAKNKTWCTNETQNTLKYATDVVN